MKVSRPTAKAFNLVVAEDGRWEDQRKGVQRFLRREARELRKLHRAGISASVDFGVLLGPDPLYITCRLPTSLLMGLAKANLKLEITCYKTSDV